MFARKRTYIGFAAFLLLEIIVLGLLQLPRVKGSIRNLIEANGYGFETYFSGLTLAFLMVVWTILFLGGLYLALVSGDMVSKEVEDGTMRMMLSRPVSRFRIVLSKALACVIYTYSLQAFVTVTALIAGHWYAGFGGLFAFAPLEGLFALYDFWTGLGRFLLGMTLLGTSLMGISMLGFMISCFNVKPAGATIITLSYFFLDSILRNFPYFASLKQYFITTHMATWLNAFQRYIPWMQILEDYVLLMAINISFFLVGWIAFERRDFKG